MIRRAGLAAMFLLAAACTKSPEDETDGGVIDPADSTVAADASTFPDAEDLEDADAPDVHPDAAEPMDAEPDAGVLLSPCGDPGSACVEPAECGTPENPPLNCDSCELSIHRSLCSAETCSTPARLNASDVHELVFLVQPTVPRPIGSFVWMAMARATPACFDVSCDDVLAKRVDFTNNCYNTLDVRYHEREQSGDTYSVAMASFVAGQPTLFIVFAYENTRGRGALLGVSCTEYQVGAPGAGLVRIQAEAMVPW